MSAPVLGENLILDRFWAQRDAPVRYEDPHGFLIEPRSDYGVQVNPDVIRLRDIPSTSWVIALGEPGIGKSTALCREYEQRQADGLTTYWLDLHSIGNVGELDQELFHSPQITEWRTSDAELYLFLDSFDECRLRINTLTAVIERELVKLPTERLHLFIGCRTADWPSSFETALETAARRHGGNSVAVLQLLPLSRENIVAAARDAGIADPYAFLNAVRTAGVGPLAAKPLTLNFLLGEYAQSGELPSGQAELYRKGCLRLCEESERRQGVMLLPHLEPDDRVAVASRLAAVTMFANRDAFWTGPTSGNVPAGDLAINAMYGSSVTNPRGTAITLNRDLMNDTLATGLFISHGEHRLGWAHQTFAEYLAARALQNPAIPISKIKELLYNEDGRVASQLRETAVWLAGMRRDVFQELSFTDPQLLLTSDVTIASDTDLRDLADSLLTSARRGTFSVRLLNNPDALLTKLKHGTIGAQVQSVLSDRSIAFDGRWLAIHIAEACQIQSVQEELLAIAIDSTENDQLRISAAFALIEVGSADTIRRLRPLLDDSTDKNQELLGTALIGLWPHHIDVAELFSRLSAPEEPNLYGSYKMFLNSYLVPKLSDTDLPMALTWLLSVTDDEDRWYA